MTIVDTTRFAIGILFALCGLFLLWHVRGTRGFGQKRQAGALLLVAGAAFVAMGLGLLDLSAIRG